MSHVVAWRVELKCVPTRMIVKKELAIEFLAAWRLGGASRAPEAADVREVEEDERLAARVQHVDLAEHRLELHLLDRRLVAPLGHAPCVQNTISNS